MSAGSTTDTNRDNDVNVVEPGGKAKETMNISKTLGFIQAP